MHEPTASEKSLFRDWIHWIMGSLVAWGLLLGLGAYLFNSNRLGSGANAARQANEESEAILRGVIVATCAVAFVSFWWLMLALRERRLNRLAAKDKS